MDKCKNHPVRVASVRCKRCHMPICQECRMQVDEGVFCSELCIEQFREFQQRVQTLGFGKSRISITALIKYAITVAILVAVIYGALYFWLGTSDPSEMFRQAFGQIRLLF